MSELTIILNQILDFTASNNSEIPNLFNLGLSISTIEKIAEVLPFKLTNEIIELYTWRDGTSNLTDVMANNFFMPLSMAIETYKEMISLEESTCDETEELGCVWRVDWLPIFYLDAVNYFVSCKDDESYGKVYEYEIGGEPELIFSNLTTMMKATLECYQNGVYKVEPQNTFLSLIDYHETYKIFAKIDPLIDHWQYLLNRYKLN